MFRKEKLYVDLRGNCFKFIEAHIDEVKKNIVISKFGSIHFPEEYLCDGIIKNSDSAVKILNNFVKKEKIKAKNVLLNISHPSIVLRIVKVPKMSENDLKDYLKLEISQYLPIEIDTNVYDFKIIEAMEEEGTKLLSIMLAAVPKDIILNYTKLFKKTGFSPVAVDVYPNSVSRLFSFNEERNIAVFEVNNSEIDFMIIEKGKLFMYTNVSLENVLSLTAQSNDRVEMILQEDKGFAKILSEITNYLRTYLNFFSSKHFGKNIDCIYILGELAMLKNIEDYFKNILSIDVMVGIPEQYSLKYEKNINFNKDFLTINERMSFYASNVGLILRSVMFKW